MGSDLKEVRGEYKGGTLPVIHSWGVRNYMLLGTKNKRSIEVNKMGTYSSLQTQ